MKRILSIISAALLLSVSAFAQNLNPVVEVTNTYEGRLSDIHKPDQLLNIPDSVTKFKLDFDYSVFEKPYKGAYEFSPYLIAMKPEAALDETARFYLRAGAGYTLRPELTFVWNPKLNRGFSANVHADAGSFIGKYRHIDMDRGEDAVLLKFDGTKEKGWYVRGGLGTDLGYAWRTGEASFSLDYVKQMDGFPRKRNYDGVVFNPSVRSTDPESSLYYEASLKYRFGRDRVTSLDPFDEHYSAFEATVGPVLDPSRKILLDLSLVTDKVGVPVYIAPDFSSARYGTFSGGHLLLTPKYSQTGERLAWSAGVRLAFLFNGGDESPEPVHFAHRGQRIFPEIHVSYKILEESLAAYAAVTGGPELHTYGSILEGNHYFSLGQHGTTDSFVFDHSIERINLTAGMKGNIKKRFQWDLSGGYAVWDHALMESLFVSSPYCYSDMKLAFADLKVLFDSQFVDVDGILSFKHASSMEDNAFAPALLTGDIRAAYDWKGRIKAGLTGNFSTSRDARYTVQGTGGSSVSQIVRLPGFVDLGLFGEYNFNRRWSVWAKAGNLLNQTIQRVPFYAEDGVYFTAGICLNIQ